MRIGLISDTHVPGAAQEPPHQVVRAFEGVELILHAGDIYVPSCLDWLERIAPVLAVEHYAPALFDGDPRVAVKRVLHLEGHTIGMVHDLMLRGLTEEIRPGVIEAERLPDRFLPLMVEKLFGTAVDIVVFGHTHHAVVEEHQGVLFVNPGSPSLPKQARRLGQVAILELTTETRSARIVDLAHVS